MQGKVEVPGDTGDCMLTELPFAVQFGADRRQLGRVVMVNHIFTHTLGTRDNRACTHQWLQAQHCCVYLQCVTLTLPRYTQSTIKGTCTALCFEQSLVSSSKTA